MRKFGWAILMVGLCVAPVRAAPPKADADWPCQQAKVADFPLASVWDGPPISVKTAAWRDDEAVATLAATMSQRRTPLNDVQVALAKLAAEVDGKARVLQAFGVAFDELVRQRADILAGLERYGRKNRETADSIRAENETAHKETSPGAGPDEAALQKLQWDLRVFEDRRRTVKYVCEAPQAIETRIGEIAALVRPAL